MDDNLYDEDDFNECSYCGCILDDGCCPNYCEEKLNPLVKDEKPFPPKLAILFEKKIK